jgi:hypothetical protein
MIIDIVWPLWFWCEGFCKIGKDPNCRDGEVERQVNTVRYI